MDEHAGWFWRWYGKEALEAQVRALHALGDLAPSWSYRNGVLLVEDAGKWTGSMLDLVGIYAATAWRLGTLFNDALPRNIGAAGKVFDPALTPIHEAALYTLTGILSTLGKIAAFTYDGKK